MDRSRTLVSLVATAIVAGFVGAACDSGTQEPAAPAPPEAPDEPATGVGMTPGERPTPAAAGSGEIDPSRYIRDMPEGASAEIPQDLPSDIPIPPGAMAAQGKGAEVDGVPMAAVQLLSDKPVAEAYDYYMDELARGGWQIEQTHDLDTNAAVNATKGSCKATIMIAPASDGGSDIFIVSEC